MTTSSRGLHLGLDVGSTETKVVAYDGDGHALAEHSAPTSWTTLPGGGAETSGRRLLEGALAAVGRVLALVDGGAVGAGPGSGTVLSLGVTGFAESGVLLDGAGAENGPVISWFDTRGRSELDRVAAADRAVPAAFSRTTGLKYNPQASVGKLAWGLTHGRVPTAGSCWLSVPEFVVHALGGDRVAEPSLASRTGLLDQDTGRASSWVADVFGVPDTLLPDGRPAGTSAGVVTLDAAPAGLRGAVLTVAGHDHPVAAVGAAVTGPGQLFNGAGTADVLLRSVPGVVTGDARAAITAAGMSVGRHVLHDTSAVLGGVNAGLVIRRVLSLLGAADTAARDQLDAAALLQPHPVPGVTVSSGGRDRDRDEVSITVHGDVEPAAVLAAALDHLEAATGDLVRIAERAVGPYTVAVCSGGWSQMASVRAAKQRVLPRLVFSPVTRPGCRGAALLGAVAAAGVGADHQQGLTDRTRRWNHADPFGVPRLPGTAGRRDPDRPARPHPLPLPTT